MIVIKIRGVLKKLFYFSATVESFTIFFCSALRNIPHLREHTVSAYVNTPFQTVDPFFEIVLVLLNR
jgi:hypothetical protein